MSQCDEWPRTATGEEYDGKHLLELANAGNNPFEGQWSVQILLEEVESHLGVQIADMPLVVKGSNNFVRVPLFLSYRVSAYTKQGIFIQCTDGRELVARLARSDVNMPDYKGFTTQRQISDVRFEAAVYSLLESNAAIKCSRLLYHREPVESPGPRLAMPKDIRGRALFVFETTKGKNNYWQSLSPNGKVRFGRNCLSARADCKQFMTGNAAWSTS
jgi:hypothetical protein